MAPLTYRFRPRFTLRSLLLAVLTLAAAATLWKNFAPWRIDREFPDLWEPSDFRILVSPDDKWIYKESTNVNSVGPPSECFIRGTLWNIDTGISRVILNDTWTAKDSPTGGNHFSKFSNDSTLLLIGLSTANHTALKLWDMRTQAERTLPFPPKHTISSAEFYNINRHIRVDLRDDSSLILDYDTGRNLHFFPDNVPIFSPSEDRYCLFEYDDSIGIYDALSYRQIAKVVPPTDWEFTYRSHIAGDDLYIGVQWTEHFYEGFPRRHTLHYDLKNPTHQPEYILDRLASVSKDGSMAAFVDEEGISLVEFPSRQKLSRISYIEDSPYRWVDWIDGNRLIFFTQTRTVYETRTGHPVYSIPEWQFYYSSPDYTRVIVTDGETGTFKICDMHTGAVLQTSPTGDIKNWTFFSDTNSFVTHSSDRIQIWTRRRPERWWGLVWLPEFWLLGIFSTTLLWSIRRDSNSHGSLGTPRNEQPQS